MNFTVNESTKNKKIDEYFNKNMNIQRNKKILNRLLKIIDDNKNKQIVFVFGVGKTCFTISQLHVHHFILKT